MGMFQYSVSLVSADGSGQEEARPWVDTGAMYCHFPESLLRALGYRPNATRAFTLAGGRTVSRPFGAVNMRIGDEIQPVHCVFDPTNEAMMLLGAIALEAFSVAADPVAMTLKPVASMMLTMLTDNQSP